MEMTKPALLAAPPAVMGGKHAVLLMHGYMGCLTRWRCSRSRKSSEVRFSVQPTDEAQTLRKLAELVETLQNSTMIPAQPTI
jgi:hypothetical protein